MLGKITVLHFPLTVYTVAGFEHSITNLVVVPMGIMYGANVDIGRWMWNNLIPAALGNMIGGGIIVGGFVTLLYSWCELCALPTLSSLAEWAHMELLSRGNKAWPPSTLRIRLEIPRQCVTCQNACTWCGVRTSYNSQEGLARRHSQKRTR
jgi:hypothetical protein